LATTMLTLLNFINEMTCSISVMGISALMTYSVLRMILGEEKNGQHDVK